MMCPPSHLPGLAEEASPYTLQAQLHGACLRGLGAELPGSHRRGLASHKCKGNLEAGLRVRPLRFLF